MISGGAVGAKEVRAQPLATIRLDGSELLSLCDHRIQGRGDPRHGPPPGCRRLSHGSVQSLSFERLRAPNEWGKWSEKDMKQMHHGITFTGSTRNLLRAAPRPLKLGPAAVTYLEGLRMTLWIP